MNFGRTPVFFYWKSTTGGCRSPSRITICATMWYDPMRSFGVRISEYQFRLSLRCIGVCIMVVVVVVAWLYYLTCSCRRRCCSYCRWSANRSAGKIAPIRSVRMNWTWLGQWSGRLRRLRNPMLRNGIKLDPEDEPARWKREPVDFVVCWSLRWAHDTRGESLVSFVARSDVLLNLPGITCPVPFYKIVIAGMQTQR